MRLKSLELQGYKTFASRTLFLFAGDITAIVGPNGSGKSNIADSLRWVLGEQSFTLLRGRKTEDMIFSGSEHRPRAGMASAAITFDNADGWLPIDFSEVTITRRAYRDGQNEYLINGQRVRLKDVSELLAQSGLAERTYTIIGQGLVDAALALKAEERRKLFEEAAGTGLHRARREEALRRLETTKRNLERVEDILAELQPRLRSLERQARRAQEYQQITADLRVLLREWYGYHWHLAQRELSEAREAARRQEESLEAARLDVSQLDVKLAALRDRLSALRASLNSWHRQSSQLHARREAISRDLAVADERVRSFLEQRQNVEQELSRSQEELVLQQERLAAAKTESQRLEVELNEARSQMEAARQALARRQVERSAADKEVQAARQMLSGLNARQGQLQARLNERRLQAERSQKACEAAESAVSQAELELENTRQQASQAVEHQQQAEDARQKAEQALSVHRQAVTDLEKARRSAQEERASIAADLARSRAELGVLEQAEKSLTGYAQGTRLLLQAARQAKLAQARGALSSHLQVPEELETAITAVLGEFLDSVLLEADPESALDLLGKQAARGVLMPLRSLKPQPPLTLKNGNNEVIGVASDLVMAPAELRPAVDLLLGQVVIVRDRAAARQVLSEIESPARAVTLRGEVFLSSGPILTGGAGGDTGQNVLSRQRRQRELAQDIHATEVEIQAIDDQLRSQEAALKQLQVDGERLNTTQRQARQEFEAALLAADQARLAQEQSARQVRWQQDQRDQLQLEIQRGEKEAAGLTKDLEAVEKDIAATREQLRNANANLASLTLEEFQVELNHWNTQSAVAERALSDARTRQRDRQVSVERVQRTHTSQEARLREITHGLHDLDAHKAAQRQAEGQIAEEIEALRVLIDPAENELESLEHQQAEQQAIETTARQALSIAEHHYAQARITLARRQEVLDSLRRRIEDDFGLVAFEYHDDVSGPKPLPLDGMVEQLPIVEEIQSDLEETIKRQRAQLRRMGAINPEAQAEFQEVRERFAFLTEQVADLHKAEIDVREVIAELDGLMQREFRKTFDAVAEEFKGIFSRLFNGGSARLVLTDPEDLTNTGIDIEARLPGRRTQGLSLLSGGERSLTATALVFALLRVSPTPFCVLDEVDAMLDEANVGRFRDLLHELSQRTQFVVVTHNRNTVQVADVIYGVTMGRDSTSQVISLKLDEVSSVVDS